jgi:voltage-gated potassium channel
MRENVRELFHGHGKTARIFRFGLLAFDLTCIAYFLYSSTLEIDATIIVIDAILGAIMTLELLVRFWVAESRKDFFLNFYTLADILVIVSLFAALVFGQFAFLRILRALRFMRSYRTMEDLRSLFPWVGRNDQVVTAATNMVVFVFIVTSIVWVLEHRINDQINNWIDALYYTVTTLTTTGFGDIILKDDLGRLLTVGIMVFGVALFLRLVQQIFRPHKIAHTCSHCGLKFHDPDASHCKHCGSIIYIETEGEA